MGIIKTKEDMINLLKTNIVSFKFTKADGEIRKMIGTLAPTIINSKSSSSQTTFNHLVSADRVSVFDVELDEWRGFNFSRLDKNSIVII